METFISLLRNALCVLKSLLPEEHYIMQPWMAFPFLNESRTMDAFSDLDGIIAVLQLVGGGFNLYKGFQGLFGGILTAECVVRWRNALAHYEQNGEGKVREAAILSNVLSRQDASNNRTILVGMCQLVIGAGFVILALFSVKALGVGFVACTLLILEVALGILLVSATRGVLKMWTLASKVKALKKPSASDVEIVEFLAPLATTSRAWEPDVTTTPTTEELQLHMEGMVSVVNSVCEASSEDFRRLARMTEKQAVLDAFLIGLNVIAFLGYGVIPLVVFFPHHAAIIHFVPHWPGNIAWWGNLAGDVAWTIEPMTMFLAPRLLGGANLQRVNKDKNAKSE